MKRHNYRMLDMLALMGWVVLFALLYCFAFAGVVSGLLTVSGEAASCCPTIQLVLLYLVLAAPALLALAVGYEAARRTDTGVLTGMAVGVAAIFILWLFELQLATPPPTPASVRFISLTLIILGFMLGGYLHSRRAKRRLAEAIQTKTADSGR